MIVAADPRILVRPEPPERAPLPEHGLTWTPCPRCWGQGRVLYQTAVGLEALTCEDCGGMREVLR